MCLNFGSFSTRIRSVLILAILMQEGGIIINNNNDNVGSGGTGGAGKSKSSQDGRHTQGREFRRSSTGLLREKG